MMKASTSPRPTSRSMHRTHRRILPILLTIIATISHPAIRVNSFSIPNPIRIDGTVRTANGIHRSSCGNATKEGKEVKEVNNGTKRKTHNRYPHSASKPSSVSPVSPVSPVLQSIAIPAFLSKLPAWSVYSLGHILGGASGTPLVARATNTWYRRIPLPSWTPPNVVFGPVWTLLYGLMGVSVSRIVAGGAVGAAVGGGAAGATMENAFSPLGPLGNFIAKVLSTLLQTTNVKSAALKLWTIHYTLNILWAPIFFGLQYLRMGLLINLFLVSTLTLILPLFYSLDPVAGVIQFPYLMWLIYATVLNSAICRLNPMKEISGSDGGGGSWWNEAMVQADLCAMGEGYNEAMFEYDLQKLQEEARIYAGL